MFGDPMSRDAPLYLSLAPVGDLASGPIGEPGSGGSGGTPGGNLGKA
jgi:hypothetical protein